MTDSNFDGTKEIHRRTLIRSTLQNLLLNNTDVLDKVFKSRPTVIWQEEMNCICIYNSRDVPKEKGSDGQLWIKRDLDLSIQIFVKQSDEIDDELDRIAKQVEDILFPLRYLTDPETKEILCDKLKLGMGEFHLSQLGQIVMGSVILTLSLVYESQFPSQDLSANYQTTSADWHSNGTPTGPTTASTVKDLFTQPS